VTLAWAATSALAQERAVRMLVGLPAGSSLDPVARQLASNTQAELAVRVQATNQAWTVMVWNANYKPR
jgi:tripartite-type tricarboxylate transporter receptor subunit TctC